MYDGPMGIFEDYGDTDEYQKFDREAADIVTDFRNGEDVQERVLEFKTRLLKSNLTWGEKLQLEAMFKQSIRTL